jgi:hypothetical protein
MSQRNDRMRRLPRNTRESIQRTAELVDQLGYNDFQLVIAAAAKAQEKVTRALLRTRRSRNRTDERIRKMRRLRHYELSAMGQNKKRPEVKFYA